MMELVSSAPPPPTLPTTPSTSLPFTASDTPPSLSTTTTTTITKEKRLIEDEVTYQSPHKYACTEATHNSYFLSSSTSTPLSSLPSFNLIRLPASVFLNMLSYLSHKELLILSCVSSALKAFVMDPMNEVWCHLNITETDPTHYFNFPNFKKTSNSIFKCIRAISLDQSSCRNFRDGVAFSNELLWLCKRCVNIRKITLGWCGDLLNSSLVNLAKEEIRLQHLCMTSNYIHISDVGIVALARMPALHSLELSCFKNISERAIKELLASSKSLQRINIHGCTCIDTAALIHLRKQFPRVKFSTVSPSLSPQSSSVAPPPYALLPSAYTSEGDGGYTITVSPPFANQLFNNRTNSSNTSLPQLSRGRIRKSNDSESATAGELSEPQTRNHGESSVGENHNGRSFKRRRVSTDAEEDPAQTCDVEDEIEDEGQTDAGNGGKLKLATNSDAWPGSEVDSDEEEEDEDFTIEDADASGSDSEDSQDSGDSEAEDSAEAVGEVSDDGDNDDGDNGDEVNEEASADSADDEANGDDSSNEQGSKDDYQEEQNDQNEEDDPNEGENSIDEADEVTIPSSDRTHSNCKDGETGKSKINSGEKEDSEEHTRTDGVSLLTSVHYQLDCGKDSAKQPL